MITAHYSDSYQGYLKKGMQNVILFIYRLCLCGTDSMFMGAESAWGGTAPPAPLTRRACLSYKYAIESPLQCTRESHSCNPSWTFTRIFVSSCRLSGWSVITFLGDSDCETYLNITKAKFSFEYSEFDEISADAQKFVTMLLNPQMKWVSSNLVKTWKMWINLFPRD